MVIVDGQQQKQSDRAHSHPEKLPHMVVSGEIMRTAVNEGHADQRVDQQQENQDPINMNEMGAVNHDKALYRGGITPLRPELL